MSADHDLHRPPLPRRFARTLKGLLLWDHDRGSWQYDVMVGLILLFVFGMPRHYFHDRPQPQATSLIEQLETGGEGIHYRVSAELLGHYGNDPRQAAETLFSGRQDHPVEILRIEPVEARDGLVVWYDVWLRQRE